MPRRSKGGDYPADWKAIARACKEAAGWKCIRCKRAHSPSTGYTLTVHHADMNPANGKWWNLLALCQRCHLHIQGKVVLERPWVRAHSEWFKPYVAGYYAFKNNLPDDRESVLPKIDELIVIGQQGVFQEALL